MYKFSKIKKNNLKGVFMTEDNIKNIENQESKKVRKNNNERGGIKRPYNRRKRELNENTKINNDDSKKTTVDLESKATKNVKQVRANRKSRKIADTIFKKSSLKIIPLGRIT